MPSSSNISSSRKYYTLLSLVIIIPFILLSASCHQDDSIPYDYVPAIWSLYLHKKGHQSNSIIRDNLVFNNKALIATTDGPDNRFISCVDIQNGQELWRWNDIYQPSTEYMDINYSLADQGLFFYQVGTRSYCIRLSDGSTYFKIRGNISYDSRISGYHNIAYLIGSITDSLSGDISYGLHELDISTGTIQPFLIAPIDSSILLSNIGDHGFSNVTLTFDGLHLVTTYVYVDSLHNVNSRLGLFDLMNKSWVYTNIVLSDEPMWYTSVFQLPVIYENKIYINVGKSLICHRFEDGQRIWKLDFTGDFLFSGYIVEDGQLLANCENGIFYCIDPETGQIKWQVEGAGTSTPLRYLNGIVYFSGGSTGRIHAIDTNTGEYVWKLDPGYYDHQEDFKPDLYAVPENGGNPGKVIICTPEKAYCLPAYR